MQNRNTRLIILVIVGLLLFTVMGFMVIKFVSNEGEKEKDEELISQLSQELEQMEANMIELGVLFDDKDVQVEEAERLLKMKSEHLAHMEKEIERLRREGRVSKQKIRQLEIELENAKNRLKIQEQALRIQQEQQKNRELAAMVDSLANGLIDVEKLQQIERENKDLQAQIERYRGQIDDLSEQTKTITEMRAGNFYFNKVRGGEKEKGLVFDADDMEVVEVCFTLFKNAYIEPGVKDIYLIIQRPNGTFMDNFAGYSTEARINGVRRIVSASTSKQYNRQDTPVCISFKPGATQSFMPGRNVVQVYCDGKLIGETILELN